ncbi:hypothetical protein C8J57DRAFT_1715252 [Mycena rebaudengoi]|nr:hypothetical protein C8J57DRAFT_1715252 [Mycena rebaudengoi]
MSTKFRVRKLDRPALDNSDPGSMPEMTGIESALGKAFTGDQLTAVLTGHDPKDPDTSHIGPFWKSSAVAGLLGGEVYVAETNEAPHKIIGCTVWFGPGHAMYDTEEQVKYSLEPIMSDFSEELQNWWHVDFIPQYNQFVTSALGEGTKHNSWHLQALGVDPDYQRQGAAALLVNKVAEKAAPTKTLLCVECSTETNVEVYTKLGFEVMPKGQRGGEETFTGIKGDSFPLWVMARTT